MLRPPAMTSKAVSAATTVVRPSGVEAMSALAYADVTATVPTMLLARENPAAPTTRTR